MNLKELLDVNLPSDKILSRKPGSPNAIINKNRNGRGSNVRKLRGRSINAAEPPEVGSEIMVRQGDGSEKQYKIIRIINDDEIGAPVKALVALPGGGDKRVVRLNIAK